MLKFGDWINRKRHNRGFGIQSPAAFFFITQVLKERLPYYAYGELEEIARNSRGMSAKKCKELFRIANYLKPDSSITVGSPTAACAICSARKNIPHTLITAEKNTQTDTAKHLELHDCRQIHGNVPALLKEVLVNSRSLGILYIGECDGRQQLLDTAMQHTCKNSIIVIEGIHRDKNAKEMWKKAIENPATIITYDLYSTGILLFNDERIKQNYKLKR